MDEKAEEGLAYKKQLLQLLKSKNIDLNDLISLDSSDDDDDDEGGAKNRILSDETDAKTIELNGKFTPAEDDKQNFQVKFIELKKSIDSEIPTAIAKLNAELELMKKSTTYVQPVASVDLDAFIWKFRVTFEWESKKYSLPIQAEDIEKLEGALFDELTYHDIVGLNYDIFFYLFFIRPFFCYSFIYYISTAQPFIVGIRKEQITQNAKSIEPSIQNDN